VRRYLNILIWCFFVIWFIIEFTLIENSFFIIFLYLTSSAVSDNSLSEEEITGFCEKSKSSDCNFCCFFFSLSLVFFFLCYTSAITLWIIVYTLMCFQLQSLIVLRMNRAGILERIICSAMKSFSAWKLSSLLRRSIFLYPYSLGLLNCYSKKN
jgi:hypothetical protein